MFFDGFNGDGAAFGLADHRDQTGLGQHHFSETVHAGGGGRAGGADGFALDRVHRADVIDHAVGEVNRQLFAFEQHVGDAFMGGVAAGQHFAVEQQRLAGFPAGDFFFGQGVEVHFFALNVIRRPVDVGPQIKRRRVQVNRAAAVHDEVGVACGGAVGDHRHRLAGRVGWVHLDLDVQHGGQATQALCANAKGVNFFHQFDAQGFYLGQLGTGGFFGLQFIHVQVVHQAFLGHQHGFFCGAANADAQHAGRAPARAHGRYGFQHPVNNGVARVQHDHLAFVLAATTLGRYRHFQRVARHQFGKDDGWRVVLGVFTVEMRVGND